MPRFARYRRTVTTIDRDQLVESAKDFADRALKAYTEEDWRVILQNAAISLEHLSKAYLASLNSVLLMEIKNGQFDSLLYLSGFNERVKKAKQPRTISVREARARVEYLLPNLAVSKSDLDQLINVRDGIIHVGYLAEANTREILTAYLRYANALYDELNVPGKGRWASHTELVDSLISRSVTDIEHQVQRKLAAAKRVFAEFMERTPGGNRDSVAATLQLDWPRMLPSEDHSELIACPACTDLQAKVFGTIETAYDPDTLDDESLMIIASAVTHTLHPQRLICGLCRLRLDSPDELKATGIPASWVVEDSFDAPGLGLPY